MLSAADDLMGRKVFSVLMVLRRSATVLPQLADADVPLLGGAEAFGQVAVADAWSSVASALTEEGFTPLDEDADRMRSEAEAGVRAVEGIRAMHEFVLVQDALRARAEEARFFDAQLNVSDDPIVEEASGLHTKEVAEHGQHTTEQKARGRELRAAMLARGTLVPADSSALEVEAGPQEEASEQMPSDDDDGPPAEGRGLRGVGLKHEERQEPRARPTTALLVRAVGGSAPPLARPVSAA
jgi:hypothetical protein